MKCKSTHKRLALFAFAVSAVSVFGCWNDDVYEKYVGGKGYTTSCTAYCDGANSLQQDRCTGPDVGGLWIESARCENPQSSSEIITSQEACEQQHGHWITGYCVINDKTGCENAGLNWHSLDYKMMDLGSSRYILKTANGYRCGSFDEIIAGNDIEKNGCSADEVKDFEESMKAGFCPDRASYCVGFDGGDSPEDKFAQIRDIGICNSCPQNQIQCDGQCVDILNDPNHCGGCKNICESGSQICQRGMCTSSEVVCDSSLIHCGYKDDEPICLDPLAPSSCGQGCDADGNIVDGITCPPNSKCVLNQNKYECACVNTWFSPCYDLDGALNSCIDVLNDPLHCGSYGECKCDADGCKFKENTVCPSGRSCENGKCKCTDNEQVNCNNDCINPKSDDKYCGASGMCEGAEQGLTCNVVGDEKCINGKCECINDTILCNGKCVKPDSDDYCGITECSEGHYDNCLLKNAKCAWNPYANDNNGAYVCGCSGKSIMCDGECIDPLTDSRFCNANSNCLDGNRGVVCDPGKACINGVCGTKCPNDGEVVCEGKCVDSSEFHVTGDCASCTSDYCYTGAVDDNGQPVDFDYKLCQAKLHDVDNCDVCGGIKCTHNYKCEEVSREQYECTCFDSCLFTKDDDEILDICITDDMDAKNIIVTPGRVQDKGTCKCKEGFADCNNNLNDGCETDLSTDENCGSCHNVCDPTGKNATDFKCRYYDESAKYACGYGICYTGFGDCDDNMSSGCEQDGLLSDINHCGSCDNQCAGGKCDNGMCCFLNKQENSAIRMGECCDNLELWQYKHNIWIFCYGDNRFGCFDKESADDLSACWKKVK